MSRWGKTTGQLLEEIQIAEAINILSLSKSTKPTIHGTVTFLENFSKETIFSLIKFWLFNKSWGGYPVIDISGKITKFAPFSTAFL